MNRKEKIVCLGGAALVLFGTFMCGVGLSAVVCNSWRDRVESEKAERAASNRSDEDNRLWNAGFDAGVLYARTPVRR